MVWEGDCDSKRVTLLQVREELFVDTSRGEKLRINFDIDFPRMPCLCESCDLASLHEHDICTYICRHVVH